MLRVGVIGAWLTLTSAHRIVDLQNVSEDIEQRPRPAPQGYSPSHQTNAAPSPGTFEIVNRQGRMREEYLDTYFGKYYPPPGSLPCHNDKEGTEKMKKQAETIQVILLKNGVQAGGYQACSGCNDIIDQYIAYCLERGSAVDYDLEDLLKDHGLTQMPTFQRFTTMARNHQLEHRQQLLPVLMDELKHISRRGVFRKIEDNDCDMIPGARFATAKEKKNGIKKGTPGQCACVNQKRMKFDVIKGFARRCRVNAVRQFDASKFQGCVCQQPHYFVSGSCEAFGSKRRNSKCMYFYGYRGYHLRCQFRAC